MVHLDDWCCIKAIWKCFIWGSVIRDKSLLTTTWHRSQTNIKISILPHSTLNNCTDKTMLRAILRNTFLCVEISGESYLKWKLGWVCFNADIEESTNPFAGSRLKLNYMTWIFIEDKLQNFFCRCLSDCLWMRTLTGMFLFPNNPKRRFRPSLTAVPDSFQNILRELAKESELIWNPAGEPRGLVNRLDLTSIM